MRLKQAMTLVRTPEEIATLLASGAVADEAYDDAWDDLVSMVGLDRATAMVNGRA